MLSKHVNAHKEQILKPLLSILEAELTKSEKEVDRNISHIQEAVAKGITAVQVAQQEVGLSMDECLQIKRGIEKDIERIHQSPHPAKKDSICGDVALTTVYVSLKGRGHLLDVLRMDDVLGWCLGECKFAIRLFTSKMFSGQKSFYESIERKFIDVIRMLDDDDEVHSNERTIFVLREHYQQCFRQFQNLRLGSKDYPIAKEKYRLTTIDFVS